MITSHDRVRIAAQGLVCERTVRRVYSGKGTSYSRLRVATAARELGLPEPPSTSSSERSPTQSPSDSSR